MIGHTKHQLAEQYLLAWQRGHVFPNYPLPQAEDDPQNQAWHEQRIFFRNQAQNVYPGFRSIDHGIRKFFQLTKSAPAYSYDRDKDTFDLIFPAYTLDSDFIVKKNVPGKEVYEHLKENLLETTLAMSLYERLGRGAQKVIVEGIPPRMLQDMHAANEENCDKFFEATRFDILEAVTQERKRRAFRANQPQLFQSISERAAVFFPSNSMRAIAVAAIADFIKNPACNN